MTHTTQSADTPALIHPALALQEQIREAVYTLRELTWDNGIIGNTSHAAEDAEENAAHKVTALVAELVALTLGLNEVAS
jgi:uncharacterized protein (UPF0147 family)